MSNVGLERGRADAGIRLERTRVGDRYVLERMQQLGATLGGEQSGHLIFLDKATTGDGLVTALHLAHIMRETGQPLSQLGAGFHRFPQVLRNVRVADRGAWEEDAEVQAAINAAEERLRRRGRLPGARGRGRRSSPGAVAVGLPGRAGPGKLAKMSALAPPIAPVDLLGVPVHPLTLAEAVAHLAEAIARRRAPTPPGFSPREADPALLARIRRAAPDILLVAFGAPRQEDWMRRYGASLSVPVTMGVGGTLDVLAGRTGGGRRRGGGRAGGLGCFQSCARARWHFFFFNATRPPFLPPLHERFRGGR